MENPISKQFAICLLVAASVLTIGSNSVSAAELSTSYGKTKCTEDKVVENTKINIIDKEGDVPTEVANKLGCDVTEENTYHLIFGEELASYGIILKSDKSKDELKNYEDNVAAIKVVKLTNTDTIDISNSVLSSDNKQVASEEKTGNQSRLLVDMVEDTLNEVEKDNQKRSKKAKAVITTNVDQTDALLSISCADENYRGAIVELTPEDRDILERLVMGEAGGEGYEGAALVAQAIRDTMVYKGFGSVEEVRKACGYSGSLKREPNQDTLNAVRYVFDEGGIVVKHHIFYFYAHKSITSKFHESQKFIIEHGGHRFFSTW